MATKPTILKATIQLSDMDRGYYDDLSLTIAQQPSETDERAMIRLLAFALHACDRLTFTEGIASQDEPDIWLKGLTGDIELWIEIGLPSEKRIRKACNRSKRVYVYAYGGRTAPVWWESMAKSVERFDNLAVMLLPADGTRALAELVQRTMTLHCAIQDGEIGIGDAAHSIGIVPKTLYSGF